jgi:hypothetical protein
LDAGIPGSNEEYDEEHGEDSNEVTDNETGEENNDETGEVNEDGKGDETSIHPGRWVAASHMGVQEAPSWSWAC